MKHFNSSKRLSNLVSSLTGVLVQVIVGEITRVEFGFWLELCLDRFGAQIPGYS